MHSDDHDRTSPPEAGHPLDVGTPHNHLIHEKSPYLLQHARNPISWHPWSPEAFDRARREDKPVFLSIGYSTCHWCHVMAHESFEDKEVAQILNQGFVAIKVDREERPDVDDTYMAVCQMMTGSGGWPLTLVLTPEKEPFFAATYLPRTTRGGRTGLIPLLQRIDALWRSDREKILQSGRQIRDILERSVEETPGEVSLQKSLLHHAMEQYAETYDVTHAGFGGAPKFPAPHNLSLLLRLWDRTGEEKARSMALQSLKAMRLGGIYDQIGFGLHRYSVDERWLVPHFEKMLYDQALFALANIEAFQVSGDPFYAQSAREVCTYVNRDLKSAEGAFCCGEDADSEGEEGTFYLWTPQQIAQILGEDLSRIFSGTFGVSEEGQFEGRNIPHMDEDLERISQRVGVPAAELAPLLEEARQRLFTARERRERPHRDDKVLTGWNGLMIAAMARTAAVLEEDDLLHQAGQAADFVLAHLRRPDGRLLRRYREGDAAIAAFLEDYAFLIWGLIELHQAGFETQRLSTALELAEAVEELFSDGQGGYYDTGRDAERVLTRGRTQHDGAIPSGTSVMALNLLRLADFTGSPSQTQRAETLLRVSLGRAEAHPTAFAQMLIALDYALGPTAQAVLAVPDPSPPPSELTRLLQKRFLPRTVLHLIRPGDAALLELAPAVHGKAPVDGRTAVYLCRNYSCQAPVTEAAELERLLADVSTPSEP